jgi:hypothetical protein
MSVFYCKLGRPNKSGMAFPKLLAIPVQCELGIHFPVNKSD